MWEIKNIVRGSGFGIREFEISRFLNTGFGKAESRREGSKKRLFVLLLAPLLFPFSPLFLGVKLLICKGKVSEKSKGSKGVPERARTALF